LAAVRKSYFFNTISSFAAALALLGSLPAPGFESDVHFGLTQWLALQAGYDAQQALAIAAGDQRVDSGDIQFEQRVYAYACPGFDPDQSRLAGQFHFPSDVSPPAPAEQRVIVAGGAAAMRQSNDILKTPPQKASFMLLKFGEALHPLQDSWSNQGVPGVPHLPASVPACHADTAWSAPQSRGDAHRADATALRPAEVLAMARATFEVLKRFPEQVPPRKPRDFDPLIPELNGFIRAATKSAKADWFRAHGIEDVSFLSGMSLPDGAHSFEPTWRGRRLPPLASMHAGQHGVRQDGLDFFSAFFSDWASAAQFAPMAAKYRADGLPASEFAARLGLWRIADHGKAALLAHSEAAFTPHQLSEAQALLRKPGALATYATPQEAYFPVLPKVSATGASPIAPFIVVPLPDSVQQHPRLLAVAKFFHAPYDTIGVVAELDAEHWHITAVTATVEH
jgi:hypothetical protein